LHQYAIPAHQHQFVFRPDIAPVLTVRPGEVVRMETSSDPAERLFAAGDNWLDVQDSRRINAVTGPIAIEGVEPGDAVSVEIMAIETLDWGWCAAIPGRGMLGDFIKTPLLRRIPILNGLVHLSDTLSVPLRPMVGCLGVAPATGESSTLAPPYPWGGNYDLLQIAVGSTIYLPAQVVGGLFSLGDLHAAMGDGEATGFSIECAAAATVRLDVVKNMRLQTPRVVTGDRLYTVGLAAKRGDWGAARAQAITRMFEYLTIERELTAHDAYLVISASVDLTFGGPAGAVAVAGLPLATLDGS
jgi:amidase